MDSLFVRDVPPRFQITTDTDLRGADVDLADCCCYATPMPA